MYPQVNYQIWCLYTLYMYWWGTWSTEGLMFIAFSLEPNYILSIILLLIANQALSFQSMFQTGSRIIIFFFCRWHLFIPCAKTVTSDLRVVKLDHSFRNNSIFFSPSVYESGLHWALYAWYLVWTLLLSVECRLCCSAAQTFKPCPMFLPLYALVFLFSDFLSPLCCSPGSLRGRHSLCFLHSAL